MRRNEVARGRLARCASISTACAIALFACLAPTQITVKLSTDVECSLVSSNGAAIFGGDPKLEGAIATTHTCTGGDHEHDLGTLVVTPSADNDDRVAITVVAGVDIRAEDCAANDYRGCIVARRRVRFVPHEPLELPIDLSRSCLDVPCTEDRTCFRGACIDSEVAPRNGCLGPDCDEVARAGVQEAGVTTDASPPSEAATQTDASFSIDAEPDNSAPGGLTWTILHDTQGLQVRGLARDGSTLWWSQDVDETYGVLMRGTLGSTFDVQTPQIVIQGRLAGLAVSGNEYAVAGDIMNGFCAQMGGGGTPLTVQCTNAAPGIGMAAQAWMTSFWVIQQAATQRYGPDPTTVTGSGGAYAEADGQYAYFVDNRTVVEVTWTGSARTNHVDILPRAGRGIGIGTSHWFVSTADGEIYAVHRASKSAVSLLPPGTITSVEDIHFDEASMRLYVAGIRGATSGIHSLSGIKAEMLP